jgi:transcriptional regulator with XRE-family HTH domain
MFEFRGDRLRELRETAGLTREGLGERVGRSAAALADWEQRRHDPHERVIPLLAAELGCSVDDLRQRV